jgi:hypothetical protein
VKLSATGSSGACTECLVSGRVTPMGGDVLVFRAGPNPRLKQRRLAPSRCRTPPPWIGTGSLDSTSNSPRAVCSSGGDLHPGRAQLLDPAVALILVQSSSATRCTACSLRSMTSFRAAAILRYRSSGGAHRAAGRRWHAVKRRRTTRDSPAVRAGGRPRGTCRSGGSRLINLEL